MNIQVFRALEGTWSFFRHIIGYGVMEGKATFTKLPSDPNVLHYIEKGQLTVEKGDVRSVSQAYKYRLSNQKVTAHQVEVNSDFAGSNNGPLIDKHEVQKISNPQLDDQLHQTIDVFFVRNPDLLLHSLVFTAAHRAMGKHLCEGDTYDATYEFHLPDQFNLTYIVKGPNKDYRMETIFKKLLQ